MSRILNQRVVRGEKRHFFERGFIKLLLNGTEQHVSRLFQFDLSDFQYDIASVEQAVVEYFFHTSTLYVFKELFLMFRTVIIEIVVNQIMSVIP
jgi:hypothetical protein